MKNLILIPALLFVILACSGQKEATKTNVQLKPGQDSSEYEILIIEPGFDNWYLTNFSQAKDRSNDYYREQNRNAVISWNNDFLSGRRSNVISTRIDYQPESDYGIDVNRKMYWYFRYIEETYGIQLF